MENNDVVYYASTIHSLTRAINFVRYIQERIDRKVGFHPNFIDKHLRVLNKMNSINAIILIANRLKLLRNTKIVGSHNR